jgi:hypothetical protein
MESRRGRTTRVAAGLRPAVAGLATGRRAARDFIPPYGLGAGATLA